MIATQQPQPDASSYNRNGLPSRYTLDTSNPFSPDKVNLLLTHLSVDCAQQRWDTVATAASVFEHEDYDGGGQHNLVGPANRALSVIKVTAVTSRCNLIPQTLVEPGEEHFSLTDISTETKVFNACSQTPPDLVRIIRAHLITVKNS